MRILILGGTKFVSRAVADVAVARGHDVTCAARGTSGAPPPGARLVHLDRADPDGFAPFVDESFDAVLETATRPSWVRQSVAALGARAGHWTYVSSISVYTDDRTPGQRPDAAKYEPAPADSIETDMEIYGALKMASEAAVGDAIGDHAFVVRPGLVVGPGDTSGRFTYWVDHLASGGDVLAPGDPGDAMQIIDVRDLAIWIVDSMESNRVGTLDATSAPVALGALLQEMTDALGTQVTLHWLGHEVLAERGVQPWMGPKSLPLWLPLPEYAGFMHRDLTESLAAGLTIRPFGETAVDTRAWLESAPNAVRTGLTRAEEADVLAGRAVS